LCEKNNEVIGFHKIDKFEADGEGNLAVNFMYFETTYVCIYDAHVLFYAL
jgi:hypothetical protein